MRLTIAILLLLALSAAACGGNSSSPLNATECTELNQIAGAAIPLFDEGTSVEDLGSALYLRDHASGNRAALESYAERVPESIREDVRILENLYAEYAAAVQNVEGRELRQGAGEVDSIREARSAPETVIDASSARVSAWTRTNCG